MVKAINLTNSLVVFLTITLVSSSFISASANVFAVGPPSNLSINAPLDGRSYVIGDTVHFSGTAIDTEDGPLSPLISWTSDLDGPLGVGGPAFPVSILSLGNHIISASVTDSDGNTFSDSITIIITEEYEEESSREIEIFVESKNGTTHMHITKNDIETEFDFSFTHVGQIFDEIKEIIEMETRNIDAEWIFNAKNDDGTLEITVESEHGVADVEIFQDGVETEFEVSSAKRDVIKNEIELLTGINLHDIDFDWTLEMEIDLDSNKYYVCHIPPGNIFNPKNLLISESSLPAHFAHGDKPGKCVDDEEEIKKQAIIAKVKKQQEEMRNKHELKEKREAFKEIKNEFKDLKNIINSEKKERINTLVDEIKEVIKKLSEDPEYDKEHKKIIKSELKEIKTKIINEIRSDAKLAKNKVDSKITKLSKSDIPKITAKKMGLDYENGKTQIAIQLDGKDPTVIEQLSSIGKINAKDDKHVQLTVKLSDLSKLRTLNGIDSIRSPFNAVQFEEALSEGVYFINADLAQFSGITGAGTKVAVLDLAFTDNPKISDNIVEVKSFRQGIGYVPIQGNDGEALHGTAVAEIISDVAPDIELYLYSMKTDIEFAAAVDEAISQQVDIIVMSAGWPNFPTDGTSHITKKIEHAVDNGIAFVVPAGNFANKHWEGSFVDSNFNNWHEFSNSDEGLTIEVTQERVDKEKPILAHLMWDVGKNDVADFELVLVDPLGQIVDYSANEQTTKSDSAFEYIHYVPDIDGIYSIGVLYAGDMSSVSERPVASLEIFSVNDDLEYPISKSSVSVPADASGAIVVGAVNHLDGKLEPFSSQGPTNNGKLAPHVVGPDGVSTLSLNGNPFYGTSATAPYIAGLAALIIQTNPDISPEQLLDQIQQNTDTSLYSNNEYDYALGYGSASATFLVEELEGFE